MVDDSGVRRTKTGWSVRVQMIEQRTGRLVNRKTTVRGSKQDARRVRDELRAELDHTQNPALCAELDRLYSFVLDCITEANMTGESSKLHAAARALNGVARRNDARAARHHRAAFNVVVWKAEF